MFTKYNGDACRSGVYCITNAINGRVYFGSAARFKRRFYSHELALRHGKHGNPFLQADFNKCGTDAFTFAVLEVVDGPREDRLAREQIYITQWHDRGKRCYNLRRDAAGHREGSPDRDPAASRVKRSEGAKAAWAARSPEARAAHRDSLRKFYDDHPEERAVIAAQSAARHADPAYAARVSTAGRKQSAAHITARVDALRANGTYTHSDARRALNSATHRKTFPLLVITAPDGTTHETADLRAFALEHGIRYRSLYESHRLGKAVIKGWRVEDAQPKI